MCFTAPTGDWKIALYLSWPGHVMERLRGSEVSPITFPDSYLLAGHDVPVLSPFLKNKTQLENLQAVTFYTKKTKFVDCISLYPKLGE